MSLINHQSNMDLLQANKEAYRFDMLLISYNGYIVSLKDFLFNSTLSKKEGERIMKEIERVESEMNDKIEQRVCFLETEGDFLKEKHQVNAPQKYRGFDQVYDEDEYIKWQKNQARKIYLNTLKKKKKLRSDSVATSV